MQRVGGYRRKTRSKLKKAVRDKGKVPIRKYFQSFEEGDKVYLVAESGVQTGLYHPRFHGKAGTISKKQGTNYYVKIKDGEKAKRILVHPVHLKKV